MSKKVWRVTISLRVYAQEERIVVSDLNQDEISDEICIKGVDYRTLDLSKLTPYHVEIDDIEMEEVK